MPATAQKAYKKEGKRATHSVSSPILKKKGPSKKKVVNFGNFQKTKSQEPECINPCKELVHKTELECLSLGQLEDLAEKLKIKCSRNTTKKQYILLLIKNEVELGELTPTMLKTILRKYHKVSVKESQNVKELAQAAYDLYRDRHHISEEIRNNPCFKVTHKELKFLSKEFPDFVTNVCNEKQIKPKTIEAILKSGFRLSNLCQEELEALIAKFYESDRNVGSKYEDQRKLMCDLYQIHLDEAEEEFGEEWYDNSGGEEDCGSEMEADDEAESEESEVETKKVKRVRTKRDTAMNSPSENELNFLNVKQLKKLLPSQLNTPRNQLRAKENIVEELLKNEDVYMQHPSFEKELLVKIANKLAKQNNIEHNLEEGSTKDDYISFIIETRMSNGECTADRSDPTQKCSCCSKRFRNKVQQTRAKHEHMKKNFVQLSDFDSDDE